MALIAEEVVEEWLNQQGYFTIRGIKLGVAEMDILAVRTTPDGYDLRHYEVQASVNPVSYISKLTKAQQKETGRAPNSAAERTTEMLKDSVDGWVENKFRMAKKAALRQKLFPGDWTYHFVVNKVKHEGELALFGEIGDVNIVRLTDVLDELKQGIGKNYTAAGKDLIDLIVMDSQ